MSKLHISPDLSLPKEAVTSTFVVYGGKGMGKTNFGSVFAEELSAARLRFAVIDPMGVWWGLRHSADGKSPGVELLILGGIKGDMPIEPTAGAVVADLVVDESVNVLIDISRHANGKMWSIGERIRFVRDYFVRLYARQGEKKQPFMQIMDEAARFCPQTVRHGEDDIAQCLGAVAVAVEEGRNVGLGVALLTQRSARLNKDVAELADCMIAFRIVGPRSIDAVLDWFGEHIAKDRWKGLIEILRKLPVGRALIVSPGWLEFEGEAQIRRRETFDSSATPKPGQKAKTPRGAAAKPNLSKYQERMKQTIEEAQKNDPRELRKQIVDLKRQLQKASEPVKAAAAKTEIKEKFVLKDGQIDRLEKLNRQFEELFVKCGKQLDLWSSHALTQLNALFARRLEVLTPINAAIAKTKFFPPGSTPTYKTEAQRAVAAPTVRQQTVPRQPSSGATGADGGDCALNKKVERALLTALAQRAGKSLTRQQVLIFADYRRSGDTDQAFRKFLQCGYVLGTGELLTVTNDGIAAIGPFNPLPTGDALRAQMLNDSRLKKVERELLRVIFEVYPDSISKNEALEHANYKRSGDTDQAFRKFVTAGWAQPDRGGLRASDELFEGNLTS